MTAGGPTHGDRGCAERARGRLSDAVDGGWLGGVAEGDAGPGEGVGHAMVAARRAGAGEGLEG